MREVVMGWFVFGLFSAGLQIVFWCLAFGRSDEESARISASCVWLVYFAAFVVARDKEKNYREELGQDGTQRPSAVRLRNAVLLNIPAACMYLNLIVWVVARESSCTPLPTGERLGMCLITGINESRWGMLVFVLTFWGAFVAPVLFLSDIEVKLRILHRAVEKKRWEEDSLVRRYGIPYGKDTH